MKKHNGRLLVQKRRYWAIPSFDIDNECTDGYTYNRIVTIRDRVETWILSAVKKRLISDVPLGTYLSGGVDSSLLTAMVATFKPGRIKTYSIGFSNENYNEFSYARMVSNIYKTDHKEILINEKNILKKCKNLYLIKTCP